MSVIVSSGAAISNNQLNRSKSKQMFTFSKEERFFQLKLSPNQSFYNLPSQLSKRGASIGYGKKSDFTKIRVPNVAYYNVPRLCENQRSDTPKYTFGINRDYYKKVIINNKGFPEKTPGPGRYNVRSPPGKEGPKYSMRKKLTSKIYEGKDTPGPNKYSNRSVIINPNGKYTLSNYINTPTAGWSLSKVDRFHMISSRTPAANAYNIENLITGKGLVYNSKYRSSDSISMGKRFKRGVFDINTCTPGPGAYEIFSEFGQYRAKNAEEFDNKLMNKTYNNSKALTLNSHRNSPRHCISSALSLRDSKENNTNSIHNILKNNSMGNIKGVLSYKAKVVATS